MGSRGPKNDFFHPDFFFSWVHTLASCFFCKKNTLILVKYSLQSPVQKKNPHIGHRGSPPCTIFLTSSEQRNIVQLCTKYEQEHSCSSFHFEEMICTSVPDKTSYYQAGCTFQKPFQPWSGSAPPPINNIMDNLATLQPNSKQQFTIF